MAELKERQAIDLIRYQQQVQGAENAAQLLAQFEAGQANERAALERQTVAN